MVEDSLEVTENNDGSEQTKIFNRMLRFMDVKFRITIELGSTRMKVHELIALKAGSVIHLDKSAGEAIEIFANEKMIAKGEVIVLEDNFGVRITDIIGK